MDLSLMNKKELYEFLKTRAPEYAVGKTRVARRILEDSIKNAFPLYAGFPQPKAIVSTKPQTATDKMMKGDTVVVKAEDFDGILGKTIISTLKSDTGSLKIGVAAPADKKKLVNFMKKKSRKQELSELMRFVGIEPAQQMLELSPKQKESINSMFDDLQLCANLFKHLHLTPEKLAGLVGLASSIDPVVVVKVLETTLGLGDIFAPNRHHHAVDMKEQAA